MAFFSWVCLFSVLFLSATGEIPEWSQLPLLVLQPMESRGPDGALSDLGGRFGGLTFSWTDIEYRVRLRTQRSGLAPGSGRRMESGSFVFHGSSISVFTSLMVCDRAQNTMAFGNSPDKRCDRAGRVRNGPERRTSGLQSGFQLS